MKISKVAWLFYNQAVLSSAAHGDQPPLLTCQTFYLCRHKQVAQDRLVFDTFHFGKDDSIRKLFEFELLLEKIEESSLFEFFLRFKIVIEINILEAWVWKGLGSCNDNNFRF